MGLLEMSADLKSPKLQLIHDDKPYSQQLYLKNIRCKISWCFIIGSCSGESASSTYIRVRNI